MTELSTGIGQKLMLAAVLPRQPGKFSLLDNQAEHTTFFSSATK